MKKGVFSLVLGFLILAFSMSFVSAACTVTAVTWLGDTDNFYSSCSGNNVITVYANVTNLSALTIQQANFSGITTSCGNNGLVNFSLFSGNTYVASCDVGNAAAALNFAGNAVITVFAREGCAGVSNNTLPVILYNMTTPPGPSGCDRFGPETTNMCNVTDFSNVNFVTEIQTNGTCQSELIGQQLPWDGFKSVVKFEFGSLDMSTPDIKDKLQALGGALTVQITPPGSFGDSLIGVNVSAFDALNTSTSISLYGLPFAVSPTISPSDEVSIDDFSLNAPYVIQVSCENIARDICKAEACAAYCPGDECNGCIDSCMDLNGSDIISQCEAENGAFTQFVPNANLTFTVGHFSTYTIGDTENPTVEITNPEDKSIVAPLPFTAHAIVNGTGSQLSNVIFSVNEQTKCSYDSSDIFSECTNLTADWTVVDCPCGMNLSEGIKSLTVGATDLGGEAGNSYSASVGFDVQFCGSTITSDLTLDQNIDCSGSGENGLTIGADDIMLDCTGYGLSSDGNNYGIFLDGHSGVTIKNCDVSYFQTGIRVLNSADITLQNNTLTYNGLAPRDASGIHLDNVSDSIIIGNNVSNNDYGIYILLSDSITIQDNDVNYNWYSGIYINGGRAESNHIITGNTVNGNAEYCSDGCGGIELNYEDNCTIQDNDVSNNGYNGISLYGSYDNQILDNTVYDNYHFGIRLSEGYLNTVSRNNLTYNGDAGMRVGGESNDSIKDNIIEGDGTFTGGKWENNYGIYLDEYQYDANFDAFESNEVSGYYYGFYAYGDNEYDLLNLTLNDEKYFDNVYGIYLEYLGDSDNMPVITDSEIYNNSDGIWLKSSYADIRNTNFNENIEIASGLHVDPNSHVNLLNGDFMDNTGYGIFDDPLSSGSVDWTITEDVKCTNNDIWISAGWITIMGGSITADNCIITVEGVELNTTAHEQGFVNFYLDTSADGNATVGGSAEGTKLEVTTNTGYGYTGNVSVTTYNQNPGGSGFSMLGLGKWIKIENQSEIHLGSVIIKVYYNQTDVDDAGLNESSLRLEYYNETNGAWTTYDAPNGGVNESGDYVWANVTHFSIWGIFGSLPVVAVTSGSSGGGAAAYGIYTITQAQLDAGYTKDFAAKGGVKFNMGNESHSVIIKAIDGDEVTIEVMSEPQIGTIKVGQEMKFDLNADGVYDISVKVNSVNAEKKTASITVKSVIETVAKEITPTPETKETLGDKIGNVVKSPSTYYLLLIILILLVVYLIMKIRRKSEMASIRHKK
jgi:parallel beta-helix repeat protein